MKRHRPEPSPRDLGKLRDLTADLREARAWLASNPSAGAAAARELGALMDECRALLAESAAQDSALLSLPPELLVRALGHVDARTLAQLDCTCKSLHGPQASGRSLVE